MIVRIARLLEEHSWRVELGSPRPRDSTRWKKLGFPDMPVSRMSARDFTRKSAFYSLAVMMTNHLPLPSLSRESIMIVQFPTDSVGDLPRWKQRAARWSLSRYRLVTYSNFNAGFIRERWGIDRIAVLPPPVQMFEYEPDQKSKMILSIGRLATEGNHKRHDVLIEAWSRLQPLLPDWHLVLAGAGAESTDYVRELRRIAAEVGRVSIHVDAEPEVIKDLYSQASIYWHAAGFGRQMDRPDMAEHFGMTTVEAMSAGAVPVVYCDGGQIEVVEGTGGYLWSDIDQLVSTTFELATMAQALGPIAKQVHLAAQRYSGENFDDRFIALVRESAA